jgi:hypothetical protein
MAGDRSLVPFGLAWGGHGAGYPPNGRCGGARARDGPAEMVGIESSRAVCHVRISREEA